MSLLPYKVYLGHCRSTMAAIAPETVAAALQQALQAASVKSA